MKSLRRNYTLEGQKINLMSYYKDEDFDPAFLCPAPPPPPPLLLYTFIQQSKNRGKNEKRK